MTKNGRAHGEIVRRKLESLAHDGRLTPEEVVADAKDPKSPLHSYFDWDDDVAARKYRIAQARTLIRSVRVEVTINDEVLYAPAFTRDPERASNEPGYRTTATLRADGVVARDALLNAAGRAGAHLTRLRPLAAAVGLEGELAGVLDEFASFRRALGLEPAD